MLNQSRKIAMYSSVKESLWAMGSLAISIVLIIKYENSDESWLVLSIIAALFLSATWLISIFASLGDALVTGSSYRANRTQYKLRKIISSNTRFTYTFKLLFYYFIGAFLYLVALIYTLFHLKEAMSGEDEAYQLATEQQKAEHQLEDAYDPTINSSDKNWKLPRGPFSDKYYFFHTKEEAYQFAIQHGISEKPERSYF